MITSRQRNWLYAILTVLILLQSFAVWHDVAHPFHIDDVQCDRLSAIQHLPTADIQSDVSLIHHFVSVTDISPNTFITLPNRQRDQHNIRAPPYYS